MIRRIAMTVAFALALGGCATYDSGYRDGSYVGTYDGGYYAAPQSGYGDYYYDRPSAAFYVDGGGYYGGPFTSFGFGYGYFPGQFGLAGFGYDPWFYNPWYGRGWYRPWPRHHSFGGSWHGNYQHHDVHVQPHHPGH